MTHALQQLLLVLLILFQGISPLVHAHTHVNQDNELTGIHIEGLSSDLDRKSKLTTAGSISEIDVVISMPSGIQHDKLLVTVKTILAISCLIFNEQYQHVNLDKIIGFSPPIIRFKNPFQIASISPRAPPVF